MSDSMDNSGGPSAKHNKPDTERQVLPGPTDLWNLKESNLEEQRVEWVARAGRWKKQGDVHQKTESFGYGE